MLTAMRVDHQQSPGRTTSDRTVHVLATLILTAGTLLLGSRPAHLLAEDTPAAVLDHTRSVYAALNSYSDTGKVLKEYSPSSRDEHSFTTYFTRSPRHFLFDYRKPDGDRLVVWGDPDAFHTWWKATGQLTDYPNPGNANAIILNDYPTSSTVTKISPMLYAKASLPGALQHFQPQKMVTADDGSGHKCFRLEGVTSDTYGTTGRQVNVHLLALWIDASSYLVRKIVEQTPAPPGALNRVTTTFNAQPNPQLNDHLFQFAVPR
jgi:outer membrane lipoprotein-sorting protein